MLLDYHTRPKTNNEPTEQKVNKVTKSHEPQKVPCSRTNHIYQNVPKEPPREKIWTTPFLSETPKSIEFLPPDLETVFLETQEQNQIFLTIQPGMKSKFYPQNK